MEFSGDTVGALYYDAWWKMRVNGKKEISRNGPVFTIREPVIMTLTQPNQRVLLDPVRDCNPFFHIAETVWMLAGSQDVNFITPFNKRYRDYADNGTEVVWGAYGHRWLQHWDIDQIQGVIDKFKQDSNCRQAVIGMWDPLADLNTDPHNDRPCNTTVMFRVVNGELDMLITNRSNDLVWGAMGANVVHFSYLHEVVATSIGLDMGNYRVVTNNLHVYPGMPRYAEIAEAGLAGVERHRIVSQYPILGAGETWDDLRADCERAVFKVLVGEELTLPDFNTRWMAGVGVPMMNAYLAGKDTVERKWWINKVVDDWGMAAKSWVARR